VEEGEIRHTLSSGQTFIRKFAEAVYLPTGCKILKVQDLKSWRFRFLLLLMGFSCTMQIYAQSS